VTLTGPELETIATEPDQGTITIVTPTEPELETIATEPDQGTITIVTPTEPEHGTVAVPIIWTLAAMIPSKNSITSEYWMPFLQT
jgi:hypothetical protein